MKPFHKILKIREARNLSSVEKVLLFTISTHLGKNEFCFVSLSLLLEETGIAKRHTLIKYLNILVKKRILIKISPNKDFKSNRYAIDYQVLVIHSTSKPLKSLVPHRDCTSPSQGPPQSLTGTRLVPHRDPKRNLNKDLKEIKEGTSSFFEPQKPEKPKLERQPKRTPEEALKLMEDKLRAEGKIH